MNLLPLCTNWCSCVELLVLLFCMIYSIIHATPLQKAALMLVAFFMSSLTFSHFLFTEPSSHPEIPFCFFNVTIHQIFCIMCNDFSLLLVYYISISFSSKGTIQKIYSVLHNNLLIIFHFYYTYPLLFL